MREKVGPAATLHVFIMGRHFPIAGSKENMAISSFGITIARSDSRRVKSVSGASDSLNSTHYRAKLAALLTALEWMSLNCHPETKKIVNTPDEAIWRHLPGNLKKWVADPKHVDHDLYEKIERAFAGVPNVSFQEITTDHPMYEKAHKLADDAVARRLKLPPKAREDEPSDLEESDFEESDLEGDARMAFERALEKDC
jgi:ribonuclease HI